MRVIAVRTVATIAAIAVLAVSAAAESLLSNISKSVRVTATDHGSSRVVTVRATFASVAPGAFDLRRDALAVTVGDLPEFQIPPRAKGRRRSGGRVIYRGTRKGTAPFLRRLVVWPVRGQVTIDVAGVPPQGSILTLDPFGVELRLGTASFFGSIRTDTTVPAGTPVPFTLTDTFPETFLCSTQTVVIIDERTWETVWSAHSLDTRPLPVVDFSKDMVVAAFLGPRENRGYSAYVTKVEERANDLLVTFTERRPSDGCNPSPKPICLYVFATVPKLPKPVQFDHRVDLYVCTDP